MGVAEPSPVTGQAFSASASGLRRFMLSKERARNLFEPRVFVREHGPGTERSCRPPGGRLIERLPTLPLLMSTTENATHAPISSVALLNESVDSVAETDFVVPVSSQASRSADTKGKPARFVVPGIGCWEAPHNSCFLHPPSPSLSLPQDVLQSHRRR